MDRKVNRFGFLISSITIFVAMIVAGTFLQARQQLPLVAPNPQPPITKTEQIPVTITPTLSNRPTTTSTRPSVNSRSTTVESLNIDQVKANSKFNAKGGGSANNGGESTAPSTQHTNQNPTGGKETTTNAAITLDLPIISATLPIPTINVRLPK